MKTNIDFDRVKAEISLLSVDTFKEFGKEVKAEAQRFIDNSKDKLTKWLQLLANDEISLGEFYWAVDSQLQLFKLEGLKEAGISKIKLDAFKSKIISILIHAVDIVI